MRVSFKIDARKSSQAFQDAGRMADAETTKGVRQAVQTIALPSVRNAVSGRLPGVTTAGATRKGGYVRQRHPGAALDEFGGVRSDVILPVSAQALSTPAGPRARVGGSRSYRGAHAIPPAIERVRPAMAVATKKATAEAFRKAGFTVH